MAAFAQSEADHAGSHDYLGLVRGVIQAVNEREIVIGGTRVAWAGLDEIKTSKALTTMTRVADLKPGDRQATATFAGVRGRVLRRYSHGGRRWLLVDTEQGAKLSWPEHETRLSADPSSADVPRKMNGAALTGR